MRCIALLITTAFLACDTEPEQAPEPPASTPIHLSIKYSSKLQTQVELDAWAEEVKAAAAAVVETEPPDEYWEVLPLFKPDLEVWIGDAAVWNVDWEPQHYSDISDAELLSAPRPDQTIGAAKLLEDEGEEFRAAEIYVALDEFDEARRLAELNFNEGEFGASAQVARWINNPELHLRSLEALYERDQITRAKSHIIRAFQDGHNDMAWAALDAFEWNPYEKLDADYTLERSALETGDPRLLIPVIESDLALWTAYTAENPWQLPDAEGRTVRYIVRLSKEDPEQALAYARTYLNSTAPLIFWYVGGYEQSMTLPTQGTFDLYELVREDEVLRARYIQLLRDGFNESFAFHKPSDEEGSCRDETASDFAQEWRSSLHDTGAQPINLLYTYIYRSRDYPQLRQTWVELLDGLELMCHGEVYKAPDQPHPRPVFVREFGRAVLGVPYDATREGLSIEERILLRRLAGEMPIGDIQTYWMDRYNAAGHHSAYSSYNDSATLLYSLATGGSISASDEAQIWTRLASDDLDRRPVRDELISRHDTALREWFGTRKTLMDALRLPFQVAFTNRRAHDERDQKGVARDGVEFASTQEAWDAVLPLLPEVYTQSPYVYEAFLKLYTPPADLTLPHEISSFPEEVSVNPEP